MLKLNMTDFIRSLDSLPESNENEPLFGTGYLTEHVALQMCIRDSLHTGAEIRHHIQQAGQQGFPVRKLVLIYPDR